MRRYNFPSYVTDIFLSSDVIILVPSLYQWIVDGRGLASVIHERLALMPILDGLFSFLDIDMVGRTDKDNRGNQIMQYSDRRTGKYILYGATKWTKAPKILPGR